MHTISGPYRSKRLIKLSYVGPRRSTDNKGQREYHPLSSFPLYFLGYGDEVAVNVELKKEVQARGVAPSNPPRTFSGLDENQTKSQEKRQTECIQTLPLSCSGLEVGYEITGRMELSRHARSASFGAMRRNLERYHAALFTK